jgi:hypothetical protein
MLNKIYKSPIFLFFFTTYPCVALLAWNIREVEWQVVIRPLFLTILISVILLFIFNFILRNISKSTLLTAFLIILFFSYGHVYNSLIINGVTTWIGKPNRILFLIYLFGAILGSWAIVARYKSSQNLTQTFNLIGLVLLVLPIYQIVGYEMGANQQQTAPTTLTLNPENNLTDIYYFILDGYNRADTLEMMGYDNSAFLAFLRDRGFYVAECSRSNYPYTMNSTASALNMDFVYSFISHKGPKDTNVNPIIQSIRANRVRAELKNLGYTDIAFDMGYKWATWWDADLYLPEQNKFEAFALSPSINPFETMYLNTTPFFVLLDKELLALPAKSHQDSGDGINLLSRYRDHYERIHYIFETIPNLVSTPGPKFLYAHLLIPHTPFVFFPDGSYNPDEKYYGVGNEYAYNDDYRIPGYINNIQFLNSSMMTIIDAILENSDTPPIIIIQGDHGYIIKEKRQDILNAYYLPGVDNSLLYPTITPINTFRVIFNEYFGGNYEYLDDKSLSADSGRPYSDREADKTTCP